MAILKLLDISTAHLSKETAEQLGYSVIKGEYIGKVVAKYSEGYFVSVPDSVATRFDDLNTVLKYAVEQGCSVVRFDADAAVDGNLPTYDW